MSFFILGPAGFIIWLFLVVLVAHLLHRQGWCLAGSIVGGLFTEFGAFFWAVYWLFTKLGAQA